MHALSQVTTFFCNADPPWRVTVAGGRTLELDWKILGTTLLWCIPNFVKVLAVLWPIQHAELQLHRPLLHTISAPGHKNRIQSIDKLHTFTKA